MKAYRWRTIVALPARRVSPRILFILSILSNDPVQTDLRIGPLKDKPRDQPSDQSVDPARWRELT
jgi:hypothetical protein